MRPGSPLRLVLQSPLFSTLNCESHERLDPGLFDIRSFRVRVLEPTDSGCLVVLGAFQHTSSSASKLPALHHYTIVSMPVDGVATSLRSSLPRQPESYIDTCTQRGSNKHRDLSTLIDSAPLHLSFFVHAPFPRPSVLGLCSIRANSRTGEMLSYRLVVNCGDSVRTVAFSVRPGSSVAMANQVRKDISAGYQAVPFAPTLHLPVAGAPSPFSWWHISLDVSACRMGGPLSVTPLSRNSRVSSSREPFQPREVEPAETISGSNVTFDSCSVLDIESLLKHCIRGRACNYDARLVALEDAHTVEHQTAQHSADTSDHTSLFVLSERLTYDASNLLLIVVVDVLLEPADDRFAGTISRSADAVHENINGATAAKNPFRFYGKSHGCKSSSAGAAVVASQPANAMTNKPSNFCNDRKHALSEWDTVLHESSVSGVCHRESSNALDTEEQVAHAAEPLESRPLPLALSDEETVASNMCMRIATQGSLQRTSSSSSDESSSTWRFEAPSTLRDTNRASTPPQVPSASHALVRNTLPTVRCMLFASINVCSGSVRVIRLSKCAPAMQPGFDSSRSLPRGKPGHGFGGGLTGVTTALVADVRRSFLPAVGHARQGLQLARELNNDTVLTGESLHALVHPSYPLALVV